ncbi:MAG: hypothetical protein MK102_08785 [Fuerstiella sp.]|nr:hypothetical protein [Fuerstiella sp.]
MRAARGKTNGLYTFHRRNYLLPYENLGQFIHRFRKLNVTVAQSNRWNDLVENGGDQNNHIMVTVDADSDEENEKKLNNACRVATRHYMNAAAVRTEHLTTSLQLPPDKVRYLELAGRGVTVRILNDWKKQVRKEIRQISNKPQFGRFGNQQTAIGGPDVQSFEKHRLWRNAVAKVCLEAESDLLIEHDARILKGAAAFVMATLDRELHLDDDQVQAFGQLVKSTEPHRVALGQDYWFELAMLARTLARADQNQLRDLLSEPQLECWKLLKNHFCYQGKDRATFITPHGDMTLMLTRRR